MKKLVMIGLVAALLGPVAAQAADRNTAWAGQQQHQVRSAHDAGRHGDGRNDTRHQAARRDHWRQDRVDEAHRQAARRWAATHNGWWRPVPGSVSAQLGPNRYLPRGYYQPAPYPLVQVLPRARAGYGYYSVGRDVVLAAIATGLIIDIIR